MNKLGVSISAVAFAAMGSSCASVIENSEAASKPNIVFILTDDQRFDAMSCLGHPFLKTPNMDRIRNEGVLFKNAFVSTSLCAPARASFLTGTYALRHGVVGNWGCEFDNEKTPSFPSVLQKSGYDTAFIGKWHMKRNASPRPGFDYWVSFPGQGRYMDQKLNINGKEVQTKGYLTDILTDYAVKYISRERDKPFCLYLSHKAVHSPFDPGPKYKDIYSDINLIEPPNFNDNYAGKPKWLRGGYAYPTDKKKEVPDSLAPKKWDPKHKRRLNYWRTLRAVDDGVGRILQVLEKEGKLDNTVIVFAGDNGYMHGEHRRGDKRVIYEESIRIPLIMRYPPKVKPDSTIDQIVLNIDMAPTLLDLAGAPIPATVQGRSVVPLLEGKTKGWRTSFLYEYYMDLTDQLPHMLGVRTEDWKYVCFPDIDDIDEMYDLKNDRYEMKNLALDPKYSEKKKELKKELENLLKETGYDRKKIRNNPYMHRSWPKDARKKKTEAKN